MARHRPVRVSGLVGRIVLALILLVMLGPPTALSAQPPGRRVALVIAQSAYSDPAALTPGDARSSARTIAAVLLHLGFDQVDSQFDLGREGIETALADFAETARGADTAIIYFVGDGYFADGRNWLAPADVRVATPSTGVPQEAFTDAMEGAKGLKILLVDAAPLSRQIAPLSDVEIADTLIVHSTRGEAAKPGDPGADIFARQFARRAVEPGLESRRLLALVAEDVATSTKGRQRPMVFGTLSGESFYLTAPTVQSGLSAADAAAWAKARSVDTETAYQEYLRLFPFGEKWSEASTTQARRRADRIRTGYQHGRGRTISLTADGKGDYPTLRQAAAAAADGDRIVLGSGRYDNIGVWLKKSVAIIGPPPGKPPAILSNTQESGMWTQGASVWLQDLTILAEGDAFTVLEGAVVLHRVKIDAAKDSTMTGVGLMVDVGSDVTVVDSEIRGTSYTIQMQGGAIAAVGSRIEQYGPEHAVVFQTQSSLPAIFVDNRILSPGSLAFMLFAGPAVFSGNDFTLTGSMNARVKLFPMLNQTEPVVVSRNRLHGGGPNVEWVDCLTVTLCPLTQRDNKGWAK